MNENEILHKIFQSSYIRKLFFSQNWYHLPNPCMKIWSNLKHNIFSMNANLVDNELIAGFEWNLENPNQIDLTWWFKPLNFLFPKEHIILYFSFIFGMDLFDSSIYSLVHLLPLLHKLWPNLTFNQFWSGGWPILTWELNLGWLPLPAPWLVTAQKLIKLFYIIVEKNWKNYVHRLGLINSHRIFKKVFNFF